MDSKLYKVLILKSTVDSVYVYVYSFSLYRYSETFILQFKYLEIK